MSFPSFPGPYEAEIFARPMPRGPLTGRGLRWTGGVGGGCLSLFEPNDTFQFDQPIATKGGGSEFRGCWSPSKIDATHIKLTGGTFTCGSIFTPDVSSIVVHATALTNIYLRATLSPTYDDGYVTGGVATACDVIGSTSELSSSGTTGYIKLCAWQAGVMVGHYEYFSLKARLGNAGVGTIVFEPGIA